MKRHNKSNRIFINTSSISKHLQCIICQEIFDNPMRYKCGHTFCSSCINIWLRSNKTCPICRKKLANPGKDLIALNIINDLPVLCIHQNCPWRGILVELDNHLKSCYFDPVKLPEAVKNTFEEDEKKSKLNKDNNDIVQEVEGIEIDINENNYTQFNLCTSLKARLYQKNPSLMNTVFQSNQLKTTDVAPKNDIDILLKYLDDNDNTKENIKPNKPEFLNVKTQRDNDNTHHKGINE